MSISKNNVVNRDRFISTTIVDTRNAYVKSLTISSSIKDSSLSIGLLMERESATFWASSWFSFPSFFVALALQFDETSDGSIVVTTLIVSSELLSLLVFEVTVVRFLFFAWVLCFAFPDVRTRLFRPFFRGRSTAARVMLGELKTSIFVKDIERFKRFLWSHQVQAQWSRREMIVHPCSKTVDWSPRREEGLFTKSKYQSARASTTSVTVPVKNYFSLSRFVPLPRRAGRSSDKI